MHLDDFSLPSYKYSQVLKMQADLKKTLSLKGQPYVTRYE